jgi:hypothetical protein
VGEGLRKIADEPLGMRIADRRKADAGQIGEMACCIFCGAKCRSWPRLCEKSEIEISDRKFVSTSTIKKNVGGDRREEAIEKTIPRVHPARTFSQPGPTPTDIAAQASVGCQGHFGSNRRGLNVT